MIGHASLFQTAAIHKDQYIQQRCLVLQVTQEANVCEAKQILLFTLLWRK